MEIRRIGSQPSGKGPAKHFADAVCVDPLADPPAPAHSVGPPAMMALQIARRVFAEAGR